MHLNTDFHLDTTFRSTVTLSFTLKVAITFQMIQELKTLAATLLDAINDKNLALNHQRKSNKYVSYESSWFFVEMCTQLGLHTVCFLPV